MELDEVTVDVVVDRNRLACGTWIPSFPRASVIAVHGIPSVAPPDPDDDGYPGLARRFARRGWRAAWADLRAVRGSGGHFSIEGWVRDLRAVIDAVRALEGASVQPLALVGSSAGGAVAVEVAARGAPIDALVLLAAPAEWITFAGDPGEGVRRVLDESGMALSPEVLADPTGWGAEFDTVTTERSIASVGVPLLIVHGSADTVVPVAHAHRLAVRTPHADLWIVEGTGHSLRREPGVVEDVAAWLEARLW